MHIAQALDLHFQRRSLPSPATAGVGSLSRSRRYFCIPCALATDSSNTREHVWCLLGLLIVSSVLCLATFEAARLSTHVLRSPCTVLDSEVTDVGTCTLCTHDQPATCELHPIATARLKVTFKPMHSDRNITAHVWYCKNRHESNPCDRDFRFQDQFALDMRLPDSQRLLAGPVPCTAGEVFAYMQMREAKGKAQECYYSSRDLTGENVWFSMPSPGLVDTAWFQKHLEYPVFLGLGGMVLLSVLLGCLALEGAELWTSGLV